MITNLDYLKTAVLMLDQGNLTPGQELQILSGIENVVTLNKDRIEHEVSKRVNKIVEDLTGDQNALVSP